MSKWLSMVYAAKRLGVHESTAREWARFGYLPVIEYEVAPGIPRYIIWEEDLTEFIRERRVRREGECIEDDEDEEDFNG